MTTAYIQLRDIIKKVDLYDVNQNIIAFSEDGGPVEEDFFLRQDKTWDGMPLYVLKDLGFNPGDIVKVVYSKAKLEALKKNKKSPLNALATFTYGSGRSVPEGIEKMLFEVGSVKQVIPIENLENGDILQVECYSFKVPTTAKSVTIPSQFLVNAEAKETEKYRLGVMIGEIISKKNENTEAKKQEIMSQYRETLDRLGLVMSKLRDINEKDLFTYTMQELNGRSRAMDQLSKDACVLNVTKLEGGKGVVVETTPLYSVIQERSPEIRVLIGPMRIEINEAKRSPYCKPNWQTKLGRYPHVMDDAGSMCVGNYASRYLELLNKKDYASCFDIAVEVMQAVNLESALSITAWLRGTGAETAFANGDYALVKEIMDKWNKETAKNFTGLEKKQALIPKSFSEDLVKEILEDFYS